MDRMDRMEQAGRAVVAVTGLGLGLIGIWLIWR